MSQVLSRHIEFDLREPDYTLPTTCTRGHVDNILIATDGRIVATCTQCGRVADMRLVEGSSLPPKQVVIFNGFQINTAPEYGPSELERAWPAVNWWIEAKRLHECLP